MTLKNVIANKGYHVSAVDFHGCVTFRIGLHLHVVFGMFMLQLFYIFMCILLVELHCVKGPRKISPRGQINYVTFLLAV